MALCVKSRGIRDVDSNKAYCPDCAADLIGPFYEKAFETVETHFLSIGPSVTCITCRLCFKELTKIGSIRECLLCQYTIREREETIASILASGGSHTIRISGSKFS